MNKLTAIELCAGAGGQALGLERAGFEHLALVEIDRNACSTLRLNRPQWNVIEQDLNGFNGKQYNGVDLVAAGLPCPPFSVAGKQLGEADERNLFPAAIRVIREADPKAVMIENVRGFLDAVFDDYRRFVVKQLRSLGYVSEWRLLNACDFGVPQLRPRVAFIAVKKGLQDGFLWPMPQMKLPPTVGQCLYDLMAEKGWKGARLWADRANEVAPTIVGGSTKHGGPDLGPTRARKAWAALGVDGLGIADTPPSQDFVGMPRLTVQMVARLQGFPNDWQFFGRKTAAYRQVGNAFPPPVAEAISSNLRNCIEAAKQVRAVG